ncbi:MAG: hypothetical protein ACUVV0_06050 [Anaerolineae bacterium]
MYGFGRGRGRGFGRGVGPGRGMGNPYPYCRFYPWLPRRWWTMPYYYPAYGFPPAVPPARFYPPRQW